MILDDIDEMIEYIKETHSNMTSIYARYLPHFPVESGIIDTLNNKLNGMDSEARGPRHDKGTGKELMSQRDILEMHKIQKANEVQPDGFAPVEEVKAYTLRALFRKVNQLCHPDKTKKFSRPTIKALRECFTDAQDAYDRREYDTLELVYIRVVYLRDELHRLDKNDKVRIENQYENLKLDIQGMHMHPLHVVLVHHSRMDVNLAKQRFRDFLYTHIGKLQEMVNELIET